MKPEYRSDQLGIGTSLKALRLTLVTSVPEYAAKNEGNNTD